MCFIYCIYNVVQPPPPSRCDLEVKVPREEDLEVKVPREEDLLEPRVEYEARHQRSGTQPVKAGRVPCGRGC